MAKRSGLCLLVSIGITALGVPTASFADTLFSLEDLRQIADHLGKQSCERSCKTDRWSLRKVPFPSGRYATEHPDENLFVAIVDQNYICGSAGCPGAYLIRSASSLMVVKEGFGVGSGHPSLALSDAEIPPASLRGKYPFIQVPLKPASSGQVQESAGVFSNPVVSRLLSAVTAGSTPALPLGVNPPLAQTAGSTPSNPALSSIGSVSSAGTEPPSAPGSYCGSTDLQKLLIPEYACFGMEGGTYPYAICAVGTLVGLKPVYFGVACRAHDDCYSRKGAKKSECDDGFQSLLRATCDETLTGFWRKLSRANCYNVASEYHHQVDSKGCEAYTNAQRRAGASNPSCGPGSDQKPAGVSDLCGSDVSKYLVPDTVCFDAQGERVPYAGCDDGRGYGTLVRYKVDFSGACKQHDLCYGKVGATKSRCDAELHQDLNSSCRTQLPNELGEKATRRCYETALLFNDVVRGQATNRFGIWMTQQIPFTGKSGCNAFVSAQRAAGNVNATCADIVGDSKPPVTVAGDESVAILQAVAKECPPTRCEARLLAVMEGKYAKVALLNKTGVGEDADFGYLKKAGNRWLLAGC